MADTDDHRNQTKGVTDQLVVEGHVDCTFEKCGVCQDLAKLEGKIHAAEEILRNLAQERIALKTSRNGSHSGFIRQLPIEIITKIFLLVDRPIDYSSTDKRNPAFPENYICARALLSSVCHRWREIALGLPQLWSKVYINVCRKPDQITEEWLNRSRPLPLNLTLYANAEYKSTTWWHDPEIAPLFALLRSHSARWGYINVEHAPDDSLHRLFNDLELLPESDSFHLRLGKYNDTKSISLHTPLQPGRFCSAFTDFTKVIPFGWSNLTHLELCNHRPNSLLEVFRQAPKLKHCVSHFMGSLRENPAEVTKIQPVVLKFLKYLELTLHGNCGKFFQHLTLPSLQHLKCDLEQLKDKTCDLDLHELGNMLARSQISPTSLTTFSLGYHASLSSDSKNIGLQEIVAGVTNLSMDIRAGRSNAFDWLFSKSSDITLLPRLQELQLRIFPGYSTYRPGVYTDGEDNGMDHFPSMDSSTCAALCDLITDHNLNANLVVDFGRVSSNHTSVNDVQDHIPQNDTPSLNPTDMNTQQYRHPLKSISITMHPVYSPSDFTIKLTRDTLSRLRQAQKNGPLKFTICSKGNQVDVLHDPRCVKDDGDGFVLLQPL